MVIDFHTHAFPDKIAKKTVASLAAAAGKRYAPCTDGTVASLLEKMELFGVDLSVLQPVLTRPSQGRGVNLWAKSCENEHLIAFGGLYPGESYQQDIDLIVSLGLRGIKLHPEYQEFRVDDPKLLPMYDYALGKGLILLFHAGYDPAYKPPFRSTPKMFARIAKELQGGTIIAAHLGGEQQWDEVEEHLCGTKVYLDTSMGFSYFSEEQFLRIVRAHGADKLLFATDSPWSRADGEIAALRALPLSEEEKEQILSGNAKRLLKLP